MSAAPRLEPMPSPGSSFAATVAETCTEMFGGHDVDPDHAPHLKSAINWICRAQDATPGGGIARGFALRRHEYFGIRGWEPGYPEVTGYTIPTLFLAAVQCNRPQLRQRALRAARWEVAVQLPNGAVQGGVIGEEMSHAVFNTGQVMFGWLSAWHETHEALFEYATRRAAQFLVEHQDADGLWRRGNSHFANRSATLYNARTAWALAAAGRVFAVQPWRDAARRGLQAVARQQDPDGWVPNCCLTDPERPLLHTLAYAIQGLLEGGRLLHDYKLVASARRAAGALAQRVDATGFMPGRFARGWEPAARWACLTGQAQMVSVWLRFAALEPGSSWRSPASRVLEFLKRTQNRHTRNDGLRGGIRGSYPIGGEYGPYEVLSWATKFFADALLRDMRLQSGHAWDDPHEALA